MLNKEGRMNQQKHLVYEPCNPIYHQMYDVLNLQTIDMDRTQL